MAAMLSGCLGSDSDNSAGIIAFEQDASVAVRKGSSQQVVLSLRYSNGVTAQSVKVATSDPGIAEVFPASCTLSSSSEESSECTLTVKGKATGRVVVVAQSPNYADALLSASVSDAITYGSLAVADAAGAFVTTSPVKVSFKATGSAPYTMPLKAKIANSSGIETSTNAFINFSSSTAGVTFDPPQCQVTSASPECDTVVSNPSPTAMTITTQVVGAVLSGNPGYTPIIVNAAANTVPTYGTIVLSSQSGNNVPNGMKAPLFVNWNNVSQADTVTVTLSIVGTGVTCRFSKAGRNSCDPRLRGS